MVKEDELTVVDYLINHADRIPDKKAFIFLSDGLHNEQTITFQELAKKVIAFSTVFQGRVKKGDRALICYPPGLEYIIAFLACLYKGIIAVPLYPPDTRSNHRIKCIIEDANPQIALCSDIPNPEQNDKIEKDSHRGRQMEWIRTNWINENTEYYYCFNREDFIDDIAFLQYTSGSTNNPKGVMITNKNLVVNSALIGDYFHHDRNTVIVNWLPPYFDAGLVWSIVNPIQVGMTSVQMSPTSFIKRPIQWLQAITKYQELGQISSGGPNFCYNICCNTIDDDKLGELDLRGWQVAFNGSEPIRVSTLQRFTKKFEVCGFKLKQFLPVYGMAENTCMVLPSDVDEDPVIKKFSADSIKTDSVVEYTNLKTGEYIEMVGCGKKIRGQELAIVNPVTNQRCNENEIGEIWIKGPSVARGYWQKDEITKDTFYGYIAETGEGPCLKSGDLGFFSDGELFVVGRSKEIIIIRGQNFYPQDIEEVVENCHPSIRAGCGAAFSIDVNDMEHLVIVYEIQRKMLPNIDLPEIKMIIKDAISREFQLNTFEIAFIGHSTFPRTMTGKKQRVLVKKMYLQKELALIG